MTELRQVASEYSATPYPGEIPTFSYCLDSTSDVLHPVAGAEEGLVVNGGERLSDYLTRDGNPLVSYTPLLSYGSNSCPSRLIEKFGGAFAQAPRPLRLAVLQARASRVRRAWARGLTRKGTVPYTLILDANSSIDAHILLLPPELLPVMDRSEGRAGAYYRAVRLRDTPVHLGSETWTQPITYLGFGDRAPLTIQGVPATPDTMSAEQAKAHVLSGAEAPREDLIPANAEIPTSVSLHQAADPEDLDRAVFRAIEQAG